MRTRSVFVLLAVFLCLIALAAPAGAAVLDGVMDIIAQADGQAVFQYSFTQEDWTVGLVAAYPVYQIGKIDSQPLYLSANVVATSDDSGINLGVGLGITIPKAVSALSVGASYATTRGWCLDIGILRF